MIGSKIGDPNIIVYTKYNNSTGLARSLSTKDAQGSVFIQKGGNMNVENVTGAEGNNVSWNCMKSCMKYYVDIFV